MFWCEMLLKSNNPRARTVKTQRSTPVTKYGLKFLLMVFVLSNVVQAASLRRYDDGDLSIVQEVF